MVRASPLLVAALLVTTTLAVVDAQMGWSHIRLRFGAEGAGESRGGVHEGATITAGKFANCEFVRSTISNADITECIVRESDVTHAQIKESFSDDLRARDAKVWGGQVYNSSLSRGIVGWVTVYDSILDSVEVKESKLFWGSVTGSIVENTSLRGTGVTSTEVRGGALVLAEVTGSTLRQTTVGGSVLTDTSLFCSPERRCLVEDTRVTNAIIENATIRGGSLSSVVLVNCRLEGNVEQENVTTRDG